MGTDWEKLAGEKGEVVPSGRFDRLFRVGKLGASIGAGTALRKVGSVFGFGSGKKDEGGEDRVLVEQAEKVAKVLGEMKGAAMKVGQMLSADPDLLPPEFTSRLTTLQAAAPPMTFRMVKDVLEEAYGQPLEAVFSEFTPEPIGSASIGQVHRGRLKTGEAVAVKVQYPGIDKTLKSDLDNLASVMAMSRVVIEKAKVQAYLQEIGRAILDESDYMTEAGNLNRFVEILSKRPGVSAPRPFDAWTRRNVLVMELIVGTKLDVALDALVDDPDRKNAILERFVETYSWLLHEQHVLHADPHPGNFLLTPDGDMVMLDFGCIKECDERFSDGVLDIMDAGWQGDDRRAAGLYRELGFGRGSQGDELFNPERMRQYHEIGLEPFLRDATFEFANWDMRRRLQRFIMEWPTFIKMTPPAEGLLVFRVLGGIKGLLTKSGGQLNVHRMAVETARRRGRLTGEPLRSALLTH
jgi:predicted unusual protein kinase regulating ubiquinone biosynthesis (AarF/ABC1/UbiB family)